MISCKSGPFKGRLDKVAILYGRERMSGCPSSPPGQGKGRGGAGRDLSKVDDSQKFILFFLQSKIPGTEVHKSVESPFVVAGRPLFKQ